MIPSLQEFIKNFHLIVDVELLRYSMINAMHRKGINHGIMNVPGPVLIYPQLVCL